MDFKIDDKVILTNYNERLNGTLWTVYEIRNDMFNYSIISTENGSMSVFECELVLSDYEENCSTIKSLLGVK